LYYLLILQITERLQRQQQAWDAKLEKEKAAKKAKMVQTKQDKSVDEMLQRQEEREQKLREKHKQKEMETKLAAEKVADEEQARKDKLRRKAQLNGVAAKENVSIIQSYIIFYFHKHNVSLANNWNHHVIFADGQSEAGRDLEIRGRREKNDEEKEEES
jgi:hypothetical protein